MFASNEVGKKKQRDVKTRKIPDIVPLGIDHFPRFHGPYLNVRFATVTLSRIGIA
jgi:hypothetical protein